MGITYNATAMMLKAKEQGVSFSRTLTLGRQLIFLTRPQVKRLRRRFWLPAQASQVEFGQYGDDFLAAVLGIDALETMDFSDYEGSTVLHDLSEPVSPDLHGRYDVVIDGGSLEHVFNFPVAIASCMQMVRPGGSLFVFSMANNHMGHGFYQFSPELFYRVFSRDNGYEIEEMVLELHPYTRLEYCRNTRCYSVVDPKTIGERVRLTSWHAAGIMVHARRVESSPIFASYPIQSDYEATYVASDDEQKPRGRARLKARIEAAIGRLPFNLAHDLYGMVQRLKYSPLNRRYFRPWKP